MVNRDDLLKFRKSVCKVYCDMEFLNCKKKCRLKDITLITAKTTKISDFLKLKKTKED